MAKRLRVCTTCRIQRITSVLLLLQFTQIEKNSKPAKEFPFTLDPFQSEAISCLDNGQSVMVSAHTSAGKTVVALYAIAMSLKNQQRVVYTSPIKALSNQKFREFKEEFSDVGLMTGDVTIDPNASCLVMTTEIWRSMQYKGSETTREVAWIIFDEVHYMRDRERGVVWEESILMAPKNARFVFLSATVPNAKEFADWVAKVHQQPCHIVYTDYRPTPLQHYIFPSGGEGLYMVVDEKAKFREDSFQKAVNALVPKAEGEKKRENGKWKKGLNVSKLGEESDIFKMVKMIIRRQYDPVILFSFSKRECEFLAMQMAKMDLNQDDEKANTETIFWSAMDMLSDDDKKLPQASCLPHLCVKRAPENGRILVVTIKDAVFSRLFHMSHSELPFFYLHIHLSLYFLVIFFNIHALILSAYS
ncbi:hypothetical protein OIU77_024049 [Salix suchowensis]|uniref:Helicase ATP-binding domain-containing protein n=1 Tax=Salix suchowensis TaxID=1278906 RepID=A0ABQ9C5Y8_9ROSI|nr:hypothetical protein OIU77_024049 [Salix suchowensis]